MWKDKQRLYVYIPRPVMVFTLSEKQQRKKRINEKSKQISGRRAGSPARSRNKGKNEKRMGFVFMFIPTAFGYLKKIVKAFVLFFSMTLYSLPEIHRLCLLCKFQSSLSLLFIVSLRDRQHSNLN